MHVSTCLMRIKICSIFFIAPQRRQLPFLAPARIEGLGPLPTPPVQFNATTISPPVASRSASTFPSLVEHFWPYCSVATELPKPSLVPYGLTMPDLPNFLEILNYTGGLLPQLCLLPCYRISDILLASPDPRLQLHFYSTTRPLRQRS